MTTARGYLDWNATTPLCDEAREAMKGTEESAWANPSSLHAMGRAAAAVCDGVRPTIASLAGLGREGAVCLVSGGTEANNLGLAAPFSDRKGGLLVTSPMEHASTLEAARRLARNEDVRVEKLQPNRAGQLDPGQLESLLRRRDAQKPALVALHGVHHETGAIQPLQDFYAVARRYGAQVHLDAVQTAGKIPVAAYAGADSVALAAHKIRGPRGIGAFVRQSGTPCRPLLFGGSQEGGLRPGTTCTTLAAGFGAAAQRALDSGPQRQAGIARLRDALEAGLLAQGAQALLSPDGRRAAHVAYVLAPKGWRRGDDLVLALSALGVYASPGSACSTCQRRPSEGITAILGGHEPLAQTGVRFSLGELTTEDDVADALEAFGRVAHAPGAFVRKGDTLAAIAFRYHLAVADLLGMNPERLSPETLTFQPHGWEAALVEAERLNLP
jgi:cysteine desulfurase